MSCFLTAKLYKAIPVYLQLLPLLHTIAIATTTCTILTTKANTTLQPQPPAPQIDISHSSLSIDNTNRYKVCHDHGFPWVMAKVAADCPPDATWWRTLLFFLWLWSPGKSLLPLRAVALTRPVVCVWFLRWMTWMATRMMVMKKQFFPLTLLTAGMVTTASFAQTICMTPESRCPWTPSDAFLVYPHEVLLGVPQNVIVTVVMDLDFQVCVWMKSRKIFERFWKDDTRWTTATPTLIQREMQKRKDIMKNEQHYIYIYICIDERERI